MFAVFSSDKSEIAHRLLGTLPYRLLLPTSRYDNLVSCPKLVGTEPLNLFTPIDNRVNDDNSPNALGIFPTNRLLPKSKYCRRTSVESVASMISLEKPFLRRLRYVNNFS